MSRCPWKIHWGVGQESTTQCDKDEHLGSPIYTDPEGQVWWGPGADIEHAGPGLPEFPGQRITWLAGDRREYTGHWPGYCANLAGEPHAGGCTLHAGHHGRCAP